MSRDPFDALRDANPVPSDSLPPAPMGEADRIMGGTGRTPWRRPGWAMAVAAAVMVLAAGGAWMLWLGADEEITAADPTTGTVSTATTATAAVMPTIQTVVFLLDDSPTGPVVVPVPRAAVAGGEADGALEALLAGPSSDELLRDLTTAIPDGIDGPPPQIVDRGAGTVFVWVPQAWVDSGYPTPDGMAQIVFTLTGIDGVDGVEFLLGDDRVAGGAVAGSGALIPKSEFADHPFVDEVVTRLTYEGWMPLAFVERPASGAGIVLPHPVFGYANSIGNQIRLTLEVDEQTLWMETVTATCGTPWSQCRGEWDWSSWAAEIPDLGYTGRANLVAEAFGSGVEVIDRRVSPITIVAASPSAATTISPTTTMADPFADVPSELAVYLLIEADATHTGPGPHLVPASRMTAILSSPLTDAPRQAMEWLLMGPLPGWLEATPAISTAIPEGTRVLGLEVADGVATVDLSSEFVGGGGSLSMTARLAQVVFTLTRFDEIDGVRFMIEGIPTTVFGGEGVVVGDPATREDFPDLVPPIMIETPMWWSIAGEHPLLVSGTADVFEGTVGLALLDGEGEEILWEGYATATCGTGCRGDWSVEIPYTVPFDQLGSLIVWEESARDGSQTNVREHPVWLRAPIGVAPGEGPACSGADVPGDLPAEPELPEAVAQTRKALFEAALACDWDTLRSAPGSDVVRLHFGEPPLDPVEWLREAETRGERPMWWLAQTLRLPAAVAQPGDSPAAPPWLWPSAYAYGSWDEIPDAGREALREVYDDEDLAGYSEFGAFFGYRVGIEADGTWMFFVTGD